MNRYGRLALEFSEQYRPVAFAAIPDPGAHFAAVGEEIAADVTRFRDEILGPRRDGEDLDAFRIRSSQALASATEVILSEHSLFQPEATDPATEDGTDDPDLDRYYRQLAMIHGALDEPL